MSALGTCVLALVCAALSPADHGRLSQVLVHCRGPLSGFEVSWPDGSSVQARLVLDAGETRELQLPLPLPAIVIPQDPQVRVDGAGEVELDALSLARSREPDPAWARIPPGLGSRPVPAALDPWRSARLPWRALCAAGACLALVVHLRSRPRAALGVGALGALLALSISSAAQPPAAVLEVLEGDGSAWTLSRSARSRMELEPGRGVHLQSDPPEAALDVAGDGSSWTLSAAGTQLVARRPVLDLEPGALGATNDLEDLPRCWVRGGSGLWSHRGPWPRGSSLPGEIDGPAPPAGLIAGLPPGRTVLLAERSRGELPGSTSAWLRRVGFQAAETDPAGSNPARH